MAKVGLDVFGTPRVTAEQRGDGTLLLRSVQPLGDYAPSLVRLFRSGAQTLLADPPDIDAGEVTDKGYINQRRVLERRSENVVRLYETPCHGDVVTA